MADIQEYSVSIKFKTEGSEKAAKDTEKVKDSIGKLKGSTKGFDSLKTGLSSVGRFAGKAATALKGFAVVTGAALVKAGKSASKYSKEMMDYIETVNLFRASMGDLADKAMELVNRGELELGLNPQEMMDAIASFQNLSEGFGIASDRAFIMSKNLAQLSGDLSSFANISYEAAQKKLMSGFSGQVLPLRKYGIALDQASLQELAYSLGIEQRVKTMTRAQKTELIYYQIMKSTQKMQGDLGRTLMSPANALRVLQNEFKSLARAVGSIFIPIIQKIIPIMRAVTKALTQAAQAIAAFFGFKIENYTADLDNVGGGLEGIADDIDDVGGAAEGTAKKLNKMLMPFDELNNINSNAGSGSGSGSGSGGIGGGSLGIELPEYDMFAFVDDRIEKFSDVLEKAKEGAHKINELLNGIDWSTIKEQAAEWGTNLGNFLNIGINEISWRTVGDTLAEGVNTIFSFLQTFIDTTDFTGLGYQISELIEGFFETVDWKKVGDTLGKGAEGALETMITFIREFDVEVIGEAIYNLFAGVNWERLGNRLGVFLLEMYKSFPSNFLVENLILKPIEWAINEVISWLNSIELPDWLGGGKPFDIDYVDIVGSYYSGVNEAIENLDDAYYGYGQSVKKAKEVTVQSFEEMEDKSFKPLKNMENNINEFGFFTEKTFEYGADTIENYNNGLESQQDKTSKSFEKIKNTALEHLDVSNKALEIGEKTIGNYNVGIANQESNTTSVFDRIKIVAQEHLDLSNQSNEWGSKTLNNYNTGVRSEEPNTIGLFDKINTMIREKLNQATVAREQGASTINNYNQGVNSGQNTTIGLFDRIKSSVRTALDNAQVARAEGQETASGYSNSLEQSIRAEAIRSSVKSSIRGMFASYNETYNWGADMATGIRDGLNANQQRIISKVREMADSIKRLLHFSRPDEGPLRDYETWMPDMIKGLSNSLIQAAPILDNAVNQIADRMAESLSNVAIPDVEQSLFVNQNNSQVIRNIGNRTNNATQDNVTGNMIRATYEAVSRALVDNRGTEDNRQIIVNIGNKELYRGYGQYQDEQSNMLGVTV